MISGVSSDTAIPYRATVPCVSRGGFILFPHRLGQAVVIAMTQLQPPGPWHRAICFCEELLISSEAFPTSELVWGLSLQLLVCSWAEGLSAGGPGAEPALISVFSDGRELVSGLCFPSKCRCFGLEHVAMSVSVVSIKH